MRVACHDERAVADQAGAEQRGGRRIVVSGWNRKAVAFVGYHVLRIASIEVITGEACVIAEIFLSAPTILAGAAGPAEPRHTDAISRAMDGACAAALNNRADDLVARNDGKLALRELAIDDMQVGAAHAARAHAYQQLLRAWCRNG